MEIGFPSGSSSGSPLSRSHVVFCYGDSQTNGTADDQSAGGFANNGNIYILTATGTWTLYTPGVSGGSGLNFGAHGTGIGPELGFANAWMTKYPSTPLYIVKDAAGGSYQSIGPTTGSATVSVTNPNTFTVNTGTVNDNEVITGAGLVDTAGRAIYKPYNGFVASVNLAANANVATVSSVAATRYNGYLSWDSASGLIWNGNSGLITNGSRQRAAAALASLSNPFIVGFMVSLGTNDRGATATGNLFQAAAQGFVARIRADLPILGARFIYTRAMTGQAASTTVRSAIAAVSAADPFVRWVDMDAQALSADAVHWKQAGLNYFGAQSFTQMGL